MTDPIIWERMKRIMRERRIGAEDPLGPLGLYATTLRPVPVPIRVRVVLVGPPDLYAALLDADADFAQLFRVKVEIEPSIPRTTENLRALDAYLMQMAREREWGSSTGAARATLLDLATRLAGDRQKVSLCLCASRGDRGVRQRSRRGARLREERLGGEGAGIARRPVRSMPRRRRRVASSRPRTSRSPGASAATARGPPSDTSASSPPRRGLARHRGLARRRRQRSIGLFCR